MHRPALASLGKPVSFDFSDEQKELQRSARRMLKKQCSTTKVWAVLESDEGFDCAARSVFLGRPGHMRPPAVVNRMSLLARRDE